MTVAEILCGMLLHNGYSQGAAIIDMCCVLVIPSHTSLIKT